VGRLRIRVLGQRREAGQVAEKHGYLTTFAGVVFLWEAL
jgi:hypothetical protein